jgi:hypothetical protein
MIRADLHPAALQAIQDLLIWGRFGMECEVSSKQIHRLLDDTEFLVGRMLTPDDDTQLFCEYLEEMTQKMKCPGIYERFAEQLEPAAI